MTLREDHLQRLNDAEVDVLIIGGGINGAVSAAALAAKGLQVALVDQDDFASGSSSNSSNLAWGGIKYLESGELLLVSKLCRSRNHLMREYPASVKEVRFFTSIRRGFRMPAFFVFLGALLYWFMGGCATRPPRYLSAKKIKAEEPIVDTSDVIGGLEYSDCYLPDNDSRFVFRFIRRAMEAGCITANYVEAKSANYDGQKWSVELNDRQTDQPVKVRAKILINACGPHLDGFNSNLEKTTDFKHIFSKGVHLIVDRLTENERILAFFASDGRLFFIIPMGPKTCIGTTDTRVDQAQVTVSDEDRQFILDNVNDMLALDKPLTQADIIAERCGVRPLVVNKNKAQAGDWAQLSRKHEIAVNRSDALISLFGGKLTDCINVGEEVVDTVAALGVDIPVRDAKWYGEPSIEDKKRFLKMAQSLRVDEKIETLSGEPLSERLWRRYGHLAFELLEVIEHNPKALHKPIAEVEYTECELALMRRTEMITQLEDFLRRRSKVVQVVREEMLSAHPGLQRVCELLFGDQGETQRLEYLARRSKIEENDSQAMVTNF